MSHAYRWRSHERALSLLLLPSLLVGCGREELRERYQPAPVEVTASFARLHDSVGPRLVVLLDSLGYHQDVLHSDSSSGPIRAQLHVDQVSDSDRLAEVYGASVSYMLHAHQRPIGGPTGMPSPQYLALQFALHGDSGRWVLLTDEGYPFSLTSESRRNDLPLDEQVAIRNLLEDRMEFMEHMDTVAARRRAVRQGRDAAAGEGASMR